MTNEANDSWNPRFFASESTDCLDYWSECEARLFGPSTEAIEELSVVNEWVILEILLKGDEARRWRLEESLCRMGHRALAMLLNLLIDCKQQPDLRGDLGSLMDFLSDSNICYGAAQALIEEGPGSPEAIRALLRVLSDRCRSLRRQGCELPSLGRGSRERRWKFLEDWPEFGKDDLPLLLTALKSERRAMSWVAAMILGSLGEAAWSARGALKSCLGEEWEDVRRAARWALAKIEQDAKPGCEDD